MHEPWNRPHFATELTYLEMWHNRLPVPSPRLVASGEIEGWGYLVMTRLPGELMSDARDQIDRTDLLAIAEQTGDLARALHALPVPTGHCPDPPWNEYLAAQISGCAATHRANALPDHLLETLDDQLAGVDLTSDSPVFLHTELADLNLMVAQRNGRWRLSGVFDFEPSRLGHPLYDLPAITIFVARGDPAMCRAALAAFGRSDLDDKLRRALLACTLLHRYSHLGFFLRQTGTDDYPRTWPAVATALLGF